MGYSSFPTHHPKPRARHKLYPGTPNLDFQHEYRKSTFGRSIYGVRPRHMLAVREVKGKLMGHFAVARSVSLCALSRGRRSGRSKPRSLGRRSVPACHGLRGSRIRGNRMRSRRGSGGESGVCFAKGWQCMRKGFFYVGLDGLLVLSRSECFA